MPVLGMHQRGLLAAYAHNFKPTYVAKKADCSATLLKPEGDVEAHVIKDGKSWKGLSPATLYTRRHVETFANEKVKFFHQADDL